MRIGDRIRQRRHELGLTQEDLADEINTTGAQICRWESGVRPAHEMLVRLADSLGVTTDWLLDGSHSSPTPHL